MHTRTYCTSLHAHARAHVTAWDMCMRMHMFTAAWPWALVPLSAGPGACPQLPPLEPAPKCRPWSLAQSAALSPLRSTAPRNAGSFTHVGVRSDCGLAGTKCPSRVAARVATRRSTQARPAGSALLRIGTPPRGPMSSAPDPWMPKRRLSRRPPSDAGSKSPADSTTAALLPLAYPSPNPNPVGGARVRRP